MTDTPREHGLPRSDSVEATLAIESMLVERNYPTSSIAAGRAGFEAAYRIAFKEAAKRAAVPGQAMTHAQLTNKMSEMYPRWAHECFAVDATELAFRAMTALLAATPAKASIVAPAQSLLRKVGDRPTVCYCPPGKCQAPKPEWCIGNRASEQPQTITKKLNVNPAWADEPTPKPQEGQWTLTAPDGRRWTAESPMRVCAAESRERIPAHVALARIARECDTPLELRATEHAKASIVDTVPTTKE